MRWVGGGAGVLLLAITAVRRQHARQAATRHVLNYTPCSAMALLVLIWRAMAQSGSQPVGGRRLSLVTTGAPTTYRDVYSVIGSRESLIICATTVTMRLAKPHK